jgi:hypothetical protein
MRTQDRSAPIGRPTDNRAMTDRHQRRADRVRLRASAPDAGVVAVRHLLTGRVAVVATENLDGLRNRVDFARQTGTFSALPDPRVAADARDHGMDGVELEILERLTVEPGSAQDNLRVDLETLAALWRERLAGA